MSNFEASTQYGDWKGTVAADEYGGGPDSLRHLFEATGMVDKDREILVGIEFYAGEGHFFFRGFYHTKSQSPDIGGWVPTLNGDFSKNGDPIQVKEVKVQITSEDFFNHFKRFNVVLIRRGLDIIEREYDLI